ADRPGTRRGKWDRHHRRRPDDSVPSLARRASEGVQTPSLARRANEGSGLQRMLDEPNPTPNGTGVVPPRRVVVLGASNVSLGFGTIVETAARLWGAPLDLLAAFGHGRSYGLRKSVLGRELPGITA